METKIIEIEALVIEIDGQQTVKKIFKRCLLILLGVFVLFLVITFPIWIWAFAKPPSVEQVVGTYTLSKNGVTDRYVLLIDGTFNQTIVYKDGKRWNAAGHWKIINLVIEIEGNLQPYSEDDGLNFVPKEPPEGIANVWYGWEGNGISRWDGRLLWKKAKN